MAEKSLQTRIQLKYDSYENWLASDLVLKAGEAAICTVPTGTAADGVALPPATLMKIGTGTQKFSELPWLQAVASDVYSWAKASTKPTYSAAEITGLADFISGEIEDTDTTYQLVAVAGSAYTYKLQSKPKNGSTWSDVSTINLSAADTRLTALEGKIGEDTVADQIATAIGELDYAGVTAPVGSVISSVSQTNGMVSASTRALTEKDIPTLSIAKTSGLQDALDGKQDDLEFGTPYNASTNKVATMSDINGLIADLNGAMHFRGKVTGSTFEAAIAASSLTFASGDVVLYGVDEYVYDGTDWHVLGNESIYQLKTDAATDKSTLETAIGKKQDALSFDGTYNASTNKAATVSTVTAAINALDKADSAVANQFVTAVKEENGVITVSRARPTAANISGLAAIATSGSTDDLVQGTNTLVLNCGSASTVI